MAVNLLPSCHRRGHSVPTYLHRIPTFTYGSGVDAMNRYCIGLPIARLVDQGMIDSGAHNSSLTVHEQL